MNDVNIKSEVSLLSDDELSYEELDAASGGDCTLVEIFQAYNGAGPLFKAWVQGGCK